jgi:hypothetical protein
LYLSAAVVSCKKEAAVAEVKSANDSIAKNETKEDQYKPIDTVFLKIKRKIILQLSMVSYKNRKRNCRKQSGTKQ